MRRGARIGTGAGAHSPPNHILKLD